MGYKVLFIKQSENLRLYLDNIKVTTEIDEILIPIPDLQMLIIDNHKVVLSAQLINKLTQHNVSVVICGLDHLPASIILAQNGHHAQSGQIMKQIEWKDQLKKMIQKEIIKTKIFNQIEVLRSNKGSNYALGLLEKYHDEVEIGDITNREGLAAKVYFRDLFGANFIRFDETKVNAGLDYGYAIFRSLISSLLVSKGLLLNLGLFHIGKTNFFNLADDLLEPFRPLVDNYVYNNLFIDGVEFDSNQRKELIKLTNSKMFINNQRQTITNTILIYIDSLLKCMDEESINYYSEPTVIYNDL